MPLGCSIGPAVDPLSHTDNYGIDLYLTVLDSITFS